MSNEMVAPAFGKADLSNCERELIHIPGSIQPHGALVVAREPDLVIVQASANAPSFFGVEAVLGQSLRELAPDLVARAEPHLTLPLQRIPIALRCRLGAERLDVDALLHRPSRGGLIVEVERAGDRVDPTAEVESALNAIVASPSLRALCDETARIFRSFTGYDRVMVYRFDDDGHGEVFSEERRPALEPFLGNRYPASDIPQMARRLYERNRVRVLVDAQYEPVPVLPRISPITGEELDMSLCFTRSMSPIHIQYLKNMGVCATLVVSIMVSGRLWGLVSCHHYAPRSLQFELRAVCELFAETIGTRVAALESFAQSQAELSVRRLEQRMIEAISRDGDWRTALFDRSQSILKPVGASGAALLLDGDILTAGEVPATPQLRELGRWLDAKPRDAGGAPIRTNSLALDEPDFAALVAVASGVLAVPISSDPGDYLVWFRPEQVRTVTWGGNPFKPFVVGNSPTDLSPRRSFAQWRQVVEGTSEPWTAPALTTARLIGATISDVVIQFRAVRMLVAQHQLDVVERQVRGSDQAVLVAGADGRVLLTSQACRALLPADRQRLEHLDDFAALFTSPMPVLRRLRDLMKTGMIWRGEAELSGPNGEPRPVLVRADPVFAAPGRALGYVVIVSDMAERKNADAARRRFQQKVVESTRFAGRLESNDDLLYQNLMSTIVENAQLAALEITDGLEARRLPELLDNVQGSVDRAAELLRHLTGRGRDKE